MTIVHVEARQMELLSKINRGFSSDLAARYEGLIQKRRAGTLSVDEQNELLRLSDQVENWEAERVEALAGLARLRGISLSRLMTELGIQASPNV